MRVEKFTADHVLIVRAAQAQRVDQPLFARTLVAQCDDPIGASLDLLSLLLQERVELTANT